MDAAREALIIGWGLHALPEPASGNINRSVWRIPDGPLWLTHVTRPDALARMVRESDLLVRLAPAAGEHGLSTPEPLPTLDGHHVLLADDGAWRLTTHVAGSAPDPTELPMYPMLAAGVGLLHSRVLADLTADRAVAESSLTATLTEPQRLDLPTTEDMRAAVDLVTQCRNTVLGGPASLIHGDLHHPNLRVDGGLLVGLLDWEFASFDPPVLDLGPLVSTLVTRSGEGFGVVRSVVAEIADTYNAAGGASVTPEGLLAAAIARRLDSIDHHRRYSTPSARDEWRLEQVSHLLRLV